MSSKSSLFCFGMGYCAEALCKSLETDGWQVSGTTREASERADVFPFDRARPLENAVAKLADASHLLVSIPPDREGDPVLDCHHAELAEMANLRWVGYLSTTGVYGDHQGGWVDETTPTAPTSDRARNRADAEEAWFRLGEAIGVPVLIFRLAGIYGPGRSQLDNVRRGTAHRISKPGQVFSRIHVDDVVGILRASMDRPRPGAIYNVCDDEAAPPDEVIAYAAELLDVPPPPLIAFDDADLSPMARSFYADNKRVRNQLVKSELRYEFKYSSYREGLKSMAN
jgi:nucleoside-diphosphate-sugar epimerase